MSITTKKFIGGLVLGTILGTMITLTTGAIMYTAHDGEEITEAQYREQSLQYLEDIRNSADIVAASFTQNSK